MPPELFKLAETTYLLIAIFAGGVIAGMVVERAFAKWRREASLKKRKFWNDVVRNSGGGTGRAPAPQDRGSPRYPDAADQLRIVMSADFTIQPLLNKGEERVFKELDRVVAGLNPDWRVMAQVSLGEVLKSADPEAYRSINSKRVDLLLMDGDCRPRHAIEYQGFGHHQGTAAARDAVKKEALRRAGIGYHEIVAGHHTPSELRQLVEKLVDKADAHVR